MLRIIRSYDHPVVRAYCWGRFRILRTRFLLEIAQYLPEEGAVIDVGCGIGMFALYFGLSRPGLRIRGLDLDPRRVAMATRSAGRLGLANVRFDVGRAEDFQADHPCDAIYTLDMIHHLPEQAVAPLLRTFHDVLIPGGRLIIKDVDTRPAWMRRFTHVLDLMMDPRHPPRYWPHEELMAVLDRTGFVTYQHAMRDVLPYPHILYACRKPDA